MADAKISALPSATTPLAGTEVLPIVQGGVTDKVTVANVTAGRAVDGLSFTATGGTVVLSAPVWNATQTWNAGGVTFTGMKLNVTDTASASGSLLMDLQVGGASKATVNKAGGLTTQSSIIAANGIFRARSDSTPIFSFGALDDVVLTRDAANTLALRNGTAAQTHNIYATYTDASNYERLNVGYSSSAFRVQGEAAGTGANRSLVFGTANTDRWQIAGSSGHLTASTTNTYDIGTSTTVAAPRNIYAGTLIQSGGQVLAGSNIIAGASNALAWSGRTAMFAASDGVMKFEKAAGGQLTVGTLPSAATVGTGTRAFVTDALVPVFGSAVAGGGTVDVPVYSDGATWLVG
jgi:hypothetical protein